MNRLRANALLLRHALRLLLRVEGTLVEDVLREVDSPCLHGVFIYLHNGEAALKLLLAVALLGGDEVVEAG
jgi:hypothetical protein